MKEKTELNLQHNLSNVPKCEGCAEYEPDFGGACNYRKDNWFVCPKVTEHLEAMEKELREIIRKQDHMMQTIPKHLRVKGGHWIDIEKVLGESK